MRQLYRTRAKSQASHTGLGRVTAQAYASILGSFEAKSAHLMTSNYLGYCFSANLLRLYRRIYATRIEFRLLGFRAFRTTSQSLEKLSGSVITRCGRLKLTVRTP